jgi:hypothetical protein
MIHWRERHLGLLDGVLLDSVFPVRWDTSMSISPFAARVLDADGRYGTQVNKALTSAMILWAIGTFFDGLPCIRTVQVREELTTSHHLSVLHYPRYPAPAICPSIPSPPIRRQ